MDLILFGDSITQGLGSKKINFDSELANRLPSGIHIKNLALTGTTIKYLKSLISDCVIHEHSIVVIVYGNVDAQLKPNRKGKIFKLLPHRYRGESGSMLLPRPFYSHVWYKRWIQRIENLARTIFRKLIFSVDGTEQWVKIDEFSRDYNQVCKTLKEMGITVICCSTVYIDNRFFPGSNGEYIKYNAVINHVALQNQITFCDIYNPLKKAVEDKGWKAIYNDDHFHPKDEGYKIIARIISEQIINLKLTTEESR